MTDIIPLSANQAAFCDRFPEGRLCRLVNRRSGTLLDIQPNLTLVNDNVPQVVGKHKSRLFIPPVSTQLETGNAESAGVQYVTLRLVFFGFIKLTVFFCFSG
jgi:hypothetical protein